jgi:general secretion pathway protein C
VANRLLAAKALASGGDAPPAAREGAALRRARRPRYGAAIALGSFLGTAAAWAVCFHLQSAALRELGSAWTTRTIVERRAALASVAPPVAKAAIVPASTELAVREPRGQVAAERMPSPARILADAGAPTHDPARLVARAERLRSSGLDVTVVQAHLSRAAALDRAFSPASGTIDPVVRDGEVAGLVLRGFRADSTPVAAGLANGDVVASLNGHALTSPAKALEAIGDARRAGRAVLEVLRGTRRLVLSIDWPEA